MHMIKLNLTHGGGVVYINPHYIMSVYSNNGTVYVSLPGDGVCNVDHDINEVIDMLKEASK